MEIPPSHFDHRAQYIERAYDSRNTWQVTIAIVRQSRPAISILRHISMLFVYNFVYI